MLDVRTPARSLALLLVSVVTACTAPQVMEVVPAADTSDPVGPYRISATVSHPTMVRDLSILWTAQAALGDGGVQTGELQRARMTQETEGFFEGAIPGQPLGTRVEYWLRLSDVTGSTSDHPDDGSKYSFTVSHADAGSR